MNSQQMNSPISNMYPNQTNNLFTKQANSNMFPNKINNNMF